MVRLPSGIAFQPAAFQYVSARYASRPTIVAVQAIEAARIKLSGVNANLHDKHHAIELASEITGNRSDVIRDPEVCARSARSPRFFSPSD